MGDGSASEGVQSKTVDDKVDLETTVGMGYQHSLTPQSGSNSGHTVIDKRGRNTLGW